MELNHIKLNPNLIASLYTSSLIEEEVAIKNEIIPTDIPPVVQEKSSEPFMFKHLGNNAKNILIVVDYTETAYLPDDHLNFLTKIISACKISLADVAIINLQAYKGKTYEEIMEYFKSKIVLLFAVTPKEFGMPVQFPYFQVQSFNRTTFLSNPPLHDIYNDESEKRKLWDCMKTIFTIK
jgi:hypothetical protein